MIEIYTDGSGHKGICSWAFIVPELGIERSGSGKGTSNIGELTAIIKAMEFCHEVGAESATIFSDSQYSINSLTVWWKTWIKNNWRTANGPVKNKDLIQNGIDVQEGLNVEMRWVKGHSGNIYNERCDQLCTYARLKEKARLS